MAGCPAPSGSHLPWRAEHGPKEKSPGEESDGRARVPHRNPTPQKFICSCRRSTSLWKSAYGTRVTSLRLYFW